MDFESLTEEQKAKARNCKNSEELLALVNEEGIELTDDQLEAISGGGSWGGFKCSDNDCTNMNCSTYCG